MMRWVRDGADWILVSGRHRVGRVIPDRHHRGMWRSRMLDGSLSDMANVTRAKEAVWIVAERELEYAEQIKRKRRAA
jgi:non-ribosomal peptide synthetase component E (peptide arylation enzyme)